MVIPKRKYMCFHGKNGAGEAGKQKTKGMPTSSFAGVRGIDVFQQKPQVIYGFRDEMVNPTP